MSSGIGDRAAVSLGLSDVTSTGGHSVSSLTDSAKFLRVAISASPPLWRTCGVGILIVLMPLWHVFDRLPVSQICICYFVDSWWRNLCGQGFFWTRQWCLLLFIISFLSRWRDSLHYYCWCLLLWVFVVVFFGLLILQHQNLQVQWFLLWLFVE